MELRIALEPYKKRWRVLRRIRADLNHPKHGAVSIDIHRRFVTDIDTIPRIPLFYQVFKARAVASYVVHDWMYSRGIKRRVCDDIMLLLLEHEGVKKRYRYPIYAAVRLFGGAYYKRRCRSLNA